MVFSRRFFRRHSSMFGGDVVVASVRFARSSPSLYSHPLGRAYWMLPSNGEPYAYHALPTQLNGIDTSIPSDITAPLGASREIRPDSRAIRPFISSTTPPGPPSRRYLRPDSWRPRVVMSSRRIRLRTIFDIPAATMLGSASVFAPCPNKAASALIG